MISYFSDKFLRKGSTVVNCWFCNKDTLVPRGNRNCFDCPSCEQYNGFTRDGSYNKVIPAQKNELLNHPVAAANQTQYTSTHLPKKDSSLCQKCNSAQDAKVKKLASFSPSKPSRYDVEIEQYRRQLEKMYPLCPRCEDLVQRVLLKQKYSLLGLKNKLCGNKVSVAPSRRRVQPLRFLPVVLAAWLILANTSRASGSGDEEPFLPWPFGWMLRVVQPAVLRTVVHSEFLLSLTAVTVQATALFTNGKRSLENVGSLLLVFQLNLLCWLRAWHWTTMQYHFVQVITCVGILSLHCLRPLQYRRKKYLLFGPKLHHTGNLQWHRMKSASPVIKNGSKINQHTSPTFNVDHHKEHFEAEPSFEIKDTNDMVKNVNGTHHDDLRMAMNNLQLGFSSTVTRENNSASMFRTKEYGGNIDTHLFRGAHGQTWNPLKDSKFLSYSHDLGYKSSATRESVLRQRHSSGVRQAGGKWNKWRGSYEPLSFVEKPYPSHSRSPSRSSGYGSLASQSSIPESVPRIVDCMGPGMHAPRWDHLGGACAPEYASSTVDLAGRHISAHNLYLGSPYVYCVFPHTLHPVAPMWSVPSYPLHVIGASPAIDNTLSADTGGGYLQYCEIAAYVGALVFLMYSASCCETQLLLGGR